MSFLSLFTSGVPAVILDVSSPKFPSFVNVPCNPLKIKCCWVFFFDGRSSVHYDNTVSTSIIRRVPINFYLFFFRFFFCVCFVFAVFSCTDLLSLCLNFYSKESKCTGFYNDFEFSLWLKCRNTWMRPKRIRSAI